MRGPFPNLCGFPAALQSSAHRVLALFRTPHKCRANSHTSASSDTGGFRVPAQQWHRSAFLKSPEGGNPAVSLQPGKSYTVRALIQPCCRFPLPLPSGPECRGSSARLSDGVRREIGTEGKMLTFHVCPAALRQAAKTDPGS